MNDEKITFDLADASYLAHVKLPHKRYPGPFSDVDPNQRGKPRPIQFGSLASPGYSRAARVGKNTNGYGLYETVWNENYPLGAPSIAGAATVFSYPNEELADADQLGRALDSLFDYTHSASSGSLLFQAIVDVRNIRYDKAGNDVGRAARFDFDISTGPLVASLDVDGPAWEVAAALQAAMNTAAGVANISVTHDEAAHKVTVSRASGPIAISPKTGPNAHLKSWELLGYHVSLDKSGSSSYTAENPLFLDADQSHHLRFVEQGPKDDSGGTITGSGNSAINVPARVVPWVLWRILAVPLEKIDIAGFRAAAASQTAAGLLISTCIGREETFGSLLARMDRAGFMDTIVDGDGIWTAVDHLSPAPPVASFADSDFLSWEIERSGTEIYKAVRLLYHMDPKRNEYIRNYEAVSVLGADVKHATEEVLEWRSDGAAEAEAAWMKQTERLHRMSANGPPRIVRFAAVTKLPHLRIGDRISLSRDRALDANGSLSAVVFRILGLTQDYLAGVCVCEAVEDLSFDS